MKTFFPSRLSDYDNDNLSLAEILWSHINFTHEIYIKAKYCKYWDYIQNKSGCEATEGLSVITGRDWAVIKLLYFTAKALLKYQVMFKVLY